MIELFNKIELNEEKDKLIVLGDLIDRGPKIRQTVDYLKALQERMTPERCIIVRGNHEDLMINYIEHHVLRNILNWDYNGGEFTRDSFGSEKKLKEAYEWFLTFPLYYETDNFICAHAGVGRRGPAYTDKETFVWDRFIAQTGIYYDKLFIYGHTPMTRVAHTDGKENKNGDVIRHYKKPGVEYDLPKIGAIGIDSGCVFYGKLTALIIEENSKFHVEQVENPKPKRKKSKDA